MGTPTYISPEQAHSGEVDARSDLYSLGVVAYQCFGGQLPIGSSCGLSTDIEPLLATLLSEDAAERPESAIEVLNTILRLERRTSLETRAASRRIISKDGDTTKFRAGTVQTTRSMKQ